MSNGNIQMVLLLAVLSIGFSCSPVETKKNPPAKIPSEEKDCFDSRKGILFEKIKQGDQKAVQCLLKNGADPNETLNTENGPLSPLLVAYFSDQLQIAKILIRSGADLQFSIQGYNLPDFITYEVWKGRQSESWLELLK